MCRKPPVVNTSKVARRMNVTTVALMYAVRSVNSEAVYKYVPTYSYCAHRESAPLVDDMI